MEIERFRDEDAEEVSALIVHTLRTVNIRDYSGEYIEDLVRRMQPDDIRALVSQCVLSANSVRANKKINSKEQK